MCFRPMRSLRATVAAAARGAVAPKTWTKPPTEVRKAARVLSGSAKQNPPPRQNPLENEGAKVAKQSDHHPQFIKKRPTTCVKP